MGFFRKKEGGFSDVIRCDEQSYLIWKWRPEGADVNSTKREESIRYGSSLRVKDGEVAVFVYNQKNGIKQDFIEGPFDGIIKTANFPVLASIVGAAFDGGSPFQAEIYFINLAEVIQVNFGVPFFDVFDPRFLDFAVPVAVRGKVTFKITDYKEFVKLHRLINFDLNDFSQQIKSSLARYIKGTVTNIPSFKGIPVLQLERRILEVNDIAKQYLQPFMESEFGVTVSSLDISDIECDKTSEGYMQLKAVTQDIETATAQAQAEVNIKQMRDMQRIQMENLEETQRIQREEMQRAQKLKTESSNLSAHQINQQAAVGIAGAEALGKMGEGGGASVDLGGAGSGAGFNPAGMMAGMAVGSAVGQNIAGMMNNVGSMGQGQPGVPPVPPVPPILKFHVVLNGQSAGPFSINELSNMVMTGQLNKDSYVWKSGMADWQTAGSVPELGNLFMPPVPPIPPVPPVI